MTIKYAQVVDEETKQCNVGIGDDVAFYKSIGMTEMDVEQAYNGGWYLKGYAPQESQEEKNAKLVQELKLQIAALDEKSSRSMRAILAGTATDDDRAFLANIEAQAEEIRERIRQLS